MRKLFEIVVVLQTVGGAIFFAALFVAPIAFSIKVLAAVGLMFVSAAVLLLIVNHIAFVEGFRVLANQIAHPSDSVEPDVLDRLNNLQGSLRLQGSNRLGYLLLGMWGVWIFLGFAMRQFVL